MADPSLVVDRRQQNPGPGLHAVVIGVSEYPHLPPMDQPPEAATFELRRLASPALSALTIHDQLLAVDAAGRLARPLKTLRLLTASSPKEAVVEQRLGHVGETSASHQAIHDALRSWRADAARARDDMALFYFSGHGIRRSLEESILLAADFCDPGAVKLARSFRLGNVRSGMAPSADFPEIARTQFYFVDACRNKPELMDRLEDTSVPRIFDADLNTLDDRRAPIFFATVSGNFASARAARQTAFCEVLCEAFQHGAVEPEKLNGIGQRVWPVKALSIKTTIDNLCKRRKYPEFELTGLVGDPMLCFRPDPPSVEIDIALLPVELGVSASVALESVPVGHAILASAQGNGLHTAVVPAGIYQASVAPQANEFLPLQSGLQRVTQQLAMPWEVDLSGGGQG